ncbi:hypothetical protein CPC08DRAFT_309440 [Agrocybe pediades]|nr:hypothetical protein CPC08DRAFT_309440 [Agrocybe pediades]
MQTSKDASTNLILHEDVLWKILLDITNEALDPHPHLLSSISQRPIVTVRHCSQVCRYWRSIILSSPSMWGRLIDVELLRRTTSDDWMKEVVRRAGGALLWVYGKIGEEYNRQDHFLFTFLRENWRRVEMLFINDRHFTGNNPAHLECQKKMWSFLLEPAPRLRWFNFSLSYRSDTLLPGCLFADNAPLLTDFYICRYSCKFSTHSSWTTNLCSVTFSTAFTVDEVLMALPGMSRLVYLGVHIGQYRSQSSRWFARPTVILPRLRTLDVCGYYGSAGTILQCITPSADCRISVIHEHMHDDFDLEPDRREYEEYEAAVAKFIAPCLSLHPPLAVVFYIGYINTSVFYDVHGVPDLRFFRISLHTPFVPSSFLMKEISNSAYSSQVRELRLRTWDGDDFGFPPLAPVSESILLAFPCVTTLCTSDDVLHSLLEDPSIAASVLPALTILKISYPHLPNPGNFKEEEPPHHRYLRLCRAIGRPLSVLEISFPFSLIEEFYNMDYLEEHVGLLVKWDFGVHSSSVGYRCGDGHPERLRFDLGNWFM